MITPRKTRIPYLDFLKFFAIASVLLGHSVEQTTGNDFWDNPIWSFIYTYHMPLFMLLCGYFFGSSLNLSFGELVKKKFVQLVIPSLSAFAIMYAFVMLTGYNPCPELMDFSWFGFFNAVWFLKCVFFCYLIGYIALKSLRSFWAAALVSIVLFTILPIALATMMEHVGDIAAISATVGHNYINDPGLNRTLMGDGLATAMAGLLGGPANTTYGENTGVLALTKIYDPLVIRIAAVFACILSFCPKFEAIINTIPSGIIGGISFVLYGMISAIGVRNVVENQVDFTNSRNLIIAAVILVCALGFNSVGGITFGIGGVSVTLSGLAIAALAGILLNAILPGNDYEFDSNPGTGEGTSLRV